MEEINEKLVKSVIRIEFLLETMLRFQIQRVIDVVIKDENDKKVYKLSGKKSASEICKTLNISATTVSNLWKKWYSQGILRKDGKQYQKVLE